MWRGKSKQNDEEVVKVHSRRKGGTRSSLYWAYIRARFLEYQRIRQILWFCVKCFCYQKRSEFHQNDDGRQQGLEGAPVAPYHKINDWFNIWYLSNLTVHVIFSLKRCCSGFESLLPHILCFEHCGKKVFSVSSLPEQCPSCRWGSSPS